MIVKQKNRISISKINKVIKKNRNILNMVKYMYEIKKAGKDVSHDIV